MGGWGERYVDLRCLVFGAWPECPLPLGLPLGRERGRGRGKARARARARAREKEKEKETEKKEKEREREREREREPGMQRQRQRGERALQITPLSTQFMLEQHGVLQLDIYHFLFNFQIPTIANCYPFHLPSLAFSIIFLITFLHEKQCCVG